MRSVRESGGRKVNENMLGFDYHTNSRTVMCKQCGKSYYQETEDQTPGFRTMDYDYCPYCHFENSRSMSVEFNNTPINNKEG